MKKLLVGILVLGSISAFAVEVNGEAALRYTPVLSATGDLVVYDDIADAIYNQMLHVPVIKSDDFEAKYGDGVACFKFINSRNSCRVSVKFTKP